MLVILRFQQSDIAKKNKSKSILHLAHENDVLNIFTYKKNFVRALIDFYGKKL